MNSSENKIRHLEMIEEIIKRMGNNSFQLKGWAVTLVSVIGALSSYGADKRFILISFLPIIVFWFLDSYYLQMERKYKILYKNVAFKNEMKIDFNMDTRIIEANKNDLKRTYFCSCLFDKHILLFYGIISIAIIALTILLLLHN